MACRRVAIGLNHSRRLKRSPPSQKVPKTPNPSRFRTQEACSELWRHLGTWSRGAEERGFLLWRPWHGEARGGTRGVNPHATHPLKRLAQPRTRSRGLETKEAPGAETRSKPRLRLDPRGPSREPRPPGSLWAQEKPLRSAGPPGHPRRGRCGRMRGHWEPGRRGRGN